MSLVALGCGLSLAGAPAARAGEIGRALARVELARPDERVVAWVRFRDRAGAEHRPADIDAVRAHWPARALERRRLRGVLRDLDASDLPVHAPYVEALVARGARLRGTSRWLNAASVEMSARAAVGLARLPFVAEVDLVPVGRRAARVSIVSDAAPDAARDAARDVAPKSGGGSPAGPAPVVNLGPGDAAWYGASYMQNALIGAPALHAAGLSGAGVVVCMLDTGFHLTHQVFAGLSVVATRDFIHGDWVVDDEPGVDDPNEASHGTYTTAAVAGRKDGTYAGVAFGASVALARTEDVRDGGVLTETPVEMDNWQFAAEWADSLGADVISSSLGYTEFDAPFPSYTYADMDGRTTVVARAAAEAARRGITVVSSAGNDGAAPWHYISTPADADTVITVGAVDSLNTLAPYSSRGPTADGRVKPDVMAMGTAAYVPRFSTDSTYFRVNGTSLSCPLVAGMAALLLEAHPGWGPFEVREALRETALNHAAPNDDIGWGLVQGQDAVAWTPSTVAVAPERTSAAGGLALAASPNPARSGERVTLRISASAPQTVVLEAFDARGRRVARLYEGRADGGRTASWDGRAAGGELAPAGIYWLRLASRTASAARTTRIVLLP